MHTAPPRTPAAERQPGLFDEPAACARTAAAPPSPPPASASTADGRTAGTPPPPPPPRAVHTAPPLKPTAEPLQVNAVGEIADALADVTGLDRVVKRRKLRRVAGRLLNGRYTAADVFEVGRRFHDLVGYSDEFRIRIPRPSLEKVEDLIGLLRAPLPTTPLSSSASPRRPVNRAEADRQLMHRTLADVFPDLGGEVAL